MSDTGGEFEVSSDLDIQVGAHHARLLADGTHLRLVTDDASALWAETARAVRSVGSRASARTVITQAATALDGAGLSVEVTGSRGTVVQLGRGRGSTSGRIATGSPHVEFGHPIAIGSAVLTSLPRRLLLGVGSAVLVLVGVRRLRARALEP